MVTNEANRERYMDLGVRFVYGSILRSLQQGAEAFRRTGRRTNQ